MPLIIPAIPNPTSGRAETPIAFINAILMGYRKYGIDPANVLTLARISLILGAILFSCFLYYMREGSLRV